MNNNDSFAWIADISSEHGVCAVQDSSSRRIYVQKRLAVYDIGVYRYLFEHHPAGTPVIVSLQNNGDLLVVTEEYISGTPLDELLNTLGRFSEDEALRIVLKLCGILKPLHLAVPPIIHRDIKPSNIIVANDGRIYLVDFNTAKIKRGEANRDTVLIGTEGYAAPEQFGFAESSPSADVFAIGMMMNLMLTGKPRSEEVYSGRLKKLIDRCVMLDPAKRFKNAEELERAMPGSAAGYRKERLPGFRTGKFWKGFIAVSVYAQLTAVAGFSTIVEGITVQSVVEFIFLLACLFTIALFVCNYRGMRSMMPLERCRYHVVRILMAIVYCIMIFVAFMAFMSFVEMLLGFDMTPATQ